MKRSNKGFTLIELLVVITIIGILATGAVTVYTSQIQKARDTTRVSDLSALRWGIEQFYQDDGEYPESSTFSGVTTYVPKLPIDPKSGQTSGSSTFEYFYNVSADSNTISNQEFEVSAHFENAGNTEKKAAEDGWDDDNRIEFGISVDDTQQLTVVVWEVAATIDSLTCVSATAGTATCSANAPVLIRGNP